MKMDCLPARLGAALAAVVSCFAVHAASDAPDDASALDLADQTPTESRQESPWRIYAEAAALRSWLRAANATDTGSRVSLDLRYDGRPAAGLRAVLSNRLDVVDTDGGDDVDKVNTLREAYLSWQVRPDLIADLGRINLRQGAAWGYNPTDFFKADTLRSIVSPDPAMLRENRLGTVAVQVQKVWSDTSLSFALSPKLASEPSDAPFSLDLGSTNGRNRWLLAASHRFSDRINPQWLLHGGQATPTQVGLNLSSPLNDSTVGFIEFSAGKGPSLAGQSLGLAEPDKWQRRIATGVTYTTSFNLSLTAEADYSSAALTRTQWNALLSGAPLDALRLLQGAQTMQELPVRRAAFFYATWRDAIVRRLDVSGFVRLDLVTHSREQWLETRYHWDRVDLALQWHLNSGGPDSVFGLAPRRRALEVSARVYF
jgi:hypothetical protein